LFLTKLEGVKITGSFDNVIITFADFTGSIGAEIDPQKINSKSLYFTTLESAKITGSLDDVYIEGANFTGSIGAEINPQTVFGKNLMCSVLTDTKITGPFDETILYKTYGSRGTKIDPDEVCKKNVDITLLDDKLELLKTSYLCYSMKKDNRSFNLTDVEVIDDTDEVDQVRNAIRKVLKRKKQ
jgi:hypothetical protein